MFKIIIFIIVIIINLFDYFLKILCFSAWCILYCGRRSLRQAGFKGYPWQQGTFPAHGQLRLISLGSVFIILGK